MNDEEKINDIENLSRCLMRMKITLGNEFSYIESSIDSLNCQMKHLMNEMDNLLEKIKVDSSEDEDVGIIGKWLNIKIQEEYEKEKKWKFLKNSKKYGEK